MYSFTALLGFQYHISISRLKDITPEEQCAVVEPLPRGQVVGKLYSTDWWGALQGST